MGIPKPLPRGHHRQLRCIDFRAAYECKRGLPYLNGEHTPSGIAVLSNAHGNVPSRRLNTKSPTAGVQCCRGKIREGVGRGGREDGTSGRLHRSSFLSACTWSLHLGQYHESCRSSFSCCRKPSRQDPSDTGPSRSARAASTDSCTCGVCERAFGAAGRGGGGPERPDRLLGNGHMSDQHLDPPQTASPSAPHS